VIISNKIFPFYVSYLNRMQLQDISFMIQSVLVVVDDY